MLNNIPKTVAKLKKFHKENTKKKVKKNSVRKNLVDDFIKNDYLIKRKVIKKSLLKVIKDKLIKNLKHSNIFTPKNGTIVNNKNCKNLFKKNNVSWFKFKKLSNSDLKKGIDTWKKKAPYVVLKDPIKFCPEILKISKNKNIKMILNNYYKDEIYNLVFAKAIYSFNNRLYPLDTQLFHNDFDGIKLVKLFIYLDDVLSQKDGPTEFIKGSNIFKVNSKNKLSKWKFRFSEDDVKKFFKKNEIVSFKGNVGDVLFLNTGITHRGKKPISRDRLILILSYSTHEEVNSTAKIKLNDYN